MKLLEMGKEEIKKLVRDFLIERLIDPDEGDYDLPLSFNDYVIFIVDDKTLVIKIFKKIVEYDPTKDDLVWEKPVGVVITIKALFDGKKLRVIEVN